MTPFRALIIDDLENARATLDADLRTYCPQIYIVGHADGVKSGIKAILEHKPDVIFLDIEMGDGTGFDLLSAIPSPGFHVIFTTGLDSYGIKAIKFSALDYLLKPVDPAELVKAVAKLEQNAGAKSVNEGLQLLLSSVKEKSGARKKIAIHSLEKVELVLIEDIIRCESQGAYTIFHLKGKEQVVATRNLKEYETLLEDHDFIRVHHSHLINFAHLKEYVKKDGGYAVMTDKSQVPVSFRKRSTLLERIGS